MTRTIAVVADAETSGARREQSTRKGASAEEAVRLHHPLEAHADRFVAHFFDDDFDRISDEIFEPDFVREDRSSLPFPPTDLAGFREAASALGDGRSPRIRRGPLLAVRPAHDSSPR